MKTAQNMSRKTALKTVTVFPFHFSTQDCDPFVEKGLEPPRSENMSTWGIPVCSCAMPEELIIAHCQSHDCHTRHEKLHAFRDQSYGPVWPCLSLSGPVWAYLGLSGPVWACLGLSGPVWAYLGLSGPVWACLGLSGPVWGSRLCGSRVCGSRLCGSRLCGSRLCGSRLCISRLCGSRLCGSRLCGSRLCTIYGEADHVRRGSRL